MRRFKREKTHEKRDEAHQERERDKRERDKTHDEAACRHGGSITCVSVVTHVSYI